MKRINAVRGVKALFYKDIMEFKNYLKLKLTHPIEAIGAIFKALMLIISIAWMPYIFSSKASMGLKLPFSLSLDIMSAVVMFILMAVFFINLIKAIEEYYPTQYTAADVNFLFTSPISSRLIYAWSIIGQIVGSILGCLFIMLSLLLMHKAFEITVNSLYIIYASIGIVLFVMVVKALKFFIYTISKLFNIGSLAAKLVYLCLGIAAIYFIISLKGSNDMLQGVLGVLGGKNFESIPIIGWTKSLVLSPFIGSASIDKLIMLALFVILMLFITIYFATDYYEEAIVSTEKMKKIRTAFNGNNMDEVQRLIEKKKKRTKSVYINWNLRNAYAFLWKAVAISRRKSKGAVNEMIKYAVIAVVGGIIGYVLRSHSYTEIIIFTIVLSRIMKDSRSSFTEGLGYELKKNYIFMLPGKVREKLLAVNIIPIVKSLIRNFVIMLPMGLFSNISIIQILSLWVILSTLNTMSLFTTTVIKVILPYEDNKNILLNYLRSIIEIFLEIPAAGLGGLIYYLFNNIVAGIFVFGVCGLLTTFVLLYISETLFGRLELNS